MHLSKVSPIYIYIYIYILITSLKTPIYPSSATGHRQLTPCLLFLLFVSSLLANTSSRHGRSKQFSANKKQQQQQKQTQRQERNNNTCAEYKKERKKKRKCQPHPKPLTPPTYPHHPNILAPTASSRRHRHRPPPRRWITLSEPPRIRI